MSLIIKISRKPGTEVLRMPELIVNDAQDIFHCLEQMDLVLHDPFFNENSPAVLRSSAVVNNSFTICVWTPDGFSLDQFKIKYFLEKTAEALSNSNYSHLYFIENHYQTLVVNSIIYVKTRNEQTIENYLFDPNKIPSVFVCQLTHQVMDTPMCLKNQPHVHVDKAAIEHYIQQFHVDPFSHEPLSMDDCTHDENLQQELDFFIKVEVLSSDIIAGINACIDIQEDLHQAYLAYEGNPYGMLKQRHQLGLFQQKQFINSQNNKIYDFTLINYPDKSQTIHALKAMLHAGLCNNPEEVSRIGSAYPDTANPYFIEFARRFGFTQHFPLPSPRPLEENAIWLAEPHRTQFRR